MFYDAEMSASVTFPSSYIIQSNVFSYSFIIIIIIIIFSFKIQFDIPQNVYKYERMIASYYRSWIQLQGSHAGCHIMSYRRLRVKDLPKVPTWRLEWDSNQRPSAPNTTTEPPCFFMLIKWLISHNYSSASIKVNKHSQSKHIGEEAKLVPRYARLC